MRLDKYLAHLQVGTRAEVKKLIKAKQVTVNGSVVVDAGLHVADDAVVAVSGQVVGGDLAVVYVMNKPAGVVTATKDDDARTVLDLVASEDLRPGLFPVGRLDKDTTGLLLLTTDGALGHELTSPKRHVDKTYLAELDTELSTAMTEQLAAGIEFKDFTSQPARVVAVSPRVAQITIHEGKFHQVKRMFHAVGAEVVSLQRIQMGSFSLPKDLAPGEYRAVSAAEMALIKA